MIASRKKGIGLAGLAWALWLPCAAGAQIVYEGAAQGLAKGKHAVLIAGDEEYRSEEALPMLAKILAARFGFQCTLLFPVDKATGAINPDVLDNEPGLAALRTADLAVLFTRFREWPDADMKEFVDYLNAGKPVIGIRTATHAFNYAKNPASPYAKYSFQSKDPAGGFGRSVLGETWINHWGAHGSQSTRGVIRVTAHSNPILKGVSDIWGPTDVYQADPLPADAEVLVDGQVLTGMKPTDPPLAGKATMPICWTRAWTGPAGKPSRIFTSTIGAAIDLQNEGLRRMFVNACLWAVGLEKSIPEKADVSYLAPYQPSEFGFGGYKKGVKPADLAWSAPVALARGTMGRGNPAVTQAPGYRYDGRRLGSGRTGARVPAAAHGETGPVPAEGGSR